MEYFVIHLEGGLAPFASLTFAFVLLGILFDENRLVDYGLTEIGVIPAM